jgi:heat shock protein HtpX
MYDQIAANKRKSAIIMVAFAAFASLIAFIAGTWLGGRSVAPYAILGALLYVGFSYFAGSKMALAVNGAHEVSKKEEPRLWRTVENLAITDGIPMPKIYVMEDAALNAFATGRDPQHAAVCATRGLLDTMTDTELEGVFAHELGHVKNYDIRVSLLAFALASVVGLISDFVLRMWFWGGGNDDDNGNNPIFMAVGIVALILSPIVAALIQAAVSRQREYLADATGALTTRYPEGLASALEKISQEGSVLRKQNTSTAHLFFANPLKGKSLTNLFSTHPPIKDRIVRLRQMGGKG